MSPGMLTLGEAMVDPPSCDRYQQHLKFRQTLTGGFSSFLFTAKLSPHKDSPTSAGPAEPISSQEPVSFYRIGCSIHDTFSPFYYIVIGSENK